MAQISYRFVARGSGENDWYVLDTQTNEIRKSLMPQMYAKAEARRLNREGPRETILKRPLASYASVARR